jgi:GNAT superfamily N-acetyltransferase
VSPVAGSGSGTRATCAPARPIIPCMAITVRAATRPDIPALLGFWLAAGENDSRPPDTPEAVVRLIDRDPDALLVAVDAGAIVGSVIAGWDGWRYHLYRLAVSPQRRREGIGRLLTDHAEARLTALGATRLDAMVLVANELGQSAWGAAGYAPQADVGAPAVNCADLVLVAQHLDGPAHRDPGDAVLHGQLSRTGPPRIRGELPGINVSFDVRGHLDGYGSG